MAICRVKSRFILPVCRSWVCSQKAGDGCGFRPSFLTGDVFWTDGRSIHLDHFTRRRSCYRLAKAGVQA
jgi:hypothetical protein